MSNAGNTCGIMRILMIKHNLVKEPCFINLRKLIHPAKLNKIIIKIWKLNFHGILSTFKTASIDYTNGTIR